MRGSSKWELLPLVQPADAGSKGLPPHWLVWPQDTEGCGGRDGGLSSEGRAQLAPARAASCGELTPAPTHPVAGCSGYADALGAKGQVQSAKFSVHLSSGSHPPAGPSSEAPCQPSPAPELKDPAWAFPAPISLQLKTGVSLGRSGLTRWARPPGGTDDNVLRKERARFHVPVSPGRPKVTACKEGRGGGVRLRRLLALLRTRSAARHKATVQELLEGLKPGCHSTISVKPAPPRAR